MRTITILVSAVVALASGPLASPAFAAPAAHKPGMTDPGQPPRAFTASTTSTDRRVPADAYGQLAIWRGYAWWQVLAYCEARFMAQELHLQRTGQTARLPEARLETDQIRAAALTRLVVDRRVLRANVTPMLIKEVEHWFLTEARHRDPATFDEVAGTCRIAVIRNGT
ncbi:MAG: hypothetical protein Q8J89_03010 [Caulobacter sp.]|nr:hypothetical protein [Caulobacter sp.]